MDSHTSWVIPLEQATAISEKNIGGKALRLVGLLNAGFSVPRGFCISVDAYEQFVKQNKLGQVINTELGRKPLSSMRWEELWDAALRIRSAYLNAPIPVAISKSIVAALCTLGEQTALAVRSSAPFEDAHNASFAGLHETVLDIKGDETLLDAVRIVWSSLWSDAALLYRRELSLDPSHSRMAVVVQEIVKREVSGVVFGQDPRDSKHQHVVVEAVPGLCADLVDGTVEPDTWILESTSGRVLEFKPGERAHRNHNVPLLEAQDLSRLFDRVRRIEAVMGWPADIEWTGRGDSLVLLQARPVTSNTDTKEDERGWYLSLRPADKRLQVLHDRVVNHLIPELKSLGVRFAAEDLSRYDDTRLAEAIDTRAEALRCWKKIYWDEFIPFAHGVRRLGTYYNDAVRPEDPYEFIGLLRGQSMLAMQRNRAMLDLAKTITKNDTLQHILERFIRAETVDDPIQFQDRLSRVLEFAEGTSFLEDFQQFMAQHMNIPYQGVRLKDHPGMVLRLILELTRVDDHRRAINIGELKLESAQVLEQKLLNAVGAPRHDEALKVVEIAKLSWRLRDDDNLLVGRIEDQLLRALNLGATRLQSVGRVLNLFQLSAHHSQIISAALRDKQGRVVELPAATSDPTASVEPYDSTESPRQLVGQPSAPGVATGRVHVVDDYQDLATFHAREVLVCNAIQPNMTHLVPLACAIVEQRGGMLIHGAIIARELGIPCVNGVPRVTALLKDGDLVTVDGDLGIVTVGKPEFELEKI